MTIMNFKNYFDKKLISSTAVFEIPFSFLILVLDYTFLWYHQTINILCYLLIIDKSL